MARSSSNVRRLFTQPLLARQPVALGAAAAATAQATAAVRAPAVLAVSAQAQAQATGSLTATASLAPSAQTAAQATASATAAANLSASAGGAATATATVVASSAPNLTPTAQARSSTAPSYALIGSVGALSGFAGINTALTPAWGAGETRAAGNLLLCWVFGGSGSAPTLPTVPAGWSTAFQQAGGLCSVSLFYKIATGSDAAPTIAGVAAVNMQGQLAEFAGNAGASPVDQANGAASLTSPIVVSTAAVDVAPGELMIFAAGVHYSTSQVDTLTVTLNNGAVANETTNNALSAGNHLDFGWGITTANAAADSTSFAFPTTNISGAAPALLTSFKLSGPLLTAPALISPVAAAQAQAAAPVTAPGSLLATAQAASAATATVTAALVPFLTPTAQAAAQATATVKNQGVVRALGTLTVTTAANARPVALTHGRQLGNPTVLGRELQPAGITHSRQQGNPTLSARALPPGIVHTRAQGQPAVNPIRPPGLTRISRALGTLTVTTLTIDRPSGLIHARAQGNATIHGHLTLTPTGVAHTRAQGNPTLSARALPAGLAHTRTLGAPAVDVQTLVPVGIYRT